MASSSTSALSRYVSYPSAFNSFPHISDSLKFEFRYKSLTLLSINSDDCLAAILCTERGMTLLTMRTSFLVAR
jgi:hypothetical protein